MNVNNVGDYFIDKEKNVWQMVAYSQEPVVIFKNHETGKVIYLRIDSLLAASFTRLVPERK